MSLGNIVDLRDKPPRFLGNPKLPLKPEKRIPLRSRRRRMRALIALIVALILVAILWGISALSYAERFTIGAVTIKNAEDVSAYEIFDFVQQTIHDGKWHYFSRNNIFFYPKHEIISGIRTRFPRVKAVEISKESTFSNQIDVTVTEREIFALWCGFDSCFDMDETGYIFANAAVGPTSTSAYEFRGGIASSSPIGQTFLPTTFEKILGFLELLKDGGLYPKGIAVQDDSDYFVLLHDGFYLKAAFSGEADMLAKNLKLVLESDALRNKEEKIEYVDLRFGNRIYYKLKGASQESL